MVKRIQVSADDTTYYTLPGNSGELRNEAGQLTDTIFGQDYESSEAGLITGSLNANAIYKGFAGYIVALLKGGSPTTMTDEAMSLVSGKTYRITASTKRVIDHATAVVVEDGGTPVDAEDILEIDYLMGKVTFQAGYTVGGSVTLTGKYIPMTAMAGAKNFTLTQTAAAIDNTDIPTAKANGGYRTFEVGLKTASLELSGIYKLSNGFLAALQARSPVYVEINPDNGGHTVCRGIFKYTGQGQSGDVGALEEETISLVLSVPDVELAAAPLRWEHGAGSTLSQAVRITLAAWQDNDSVFLKYLHDGTNGQKFSAIPVDVSLSGGLDNMNEFTANYQMSGAPTVVP